VQQEWITNLSNYKYPMVEIIFKELSYQINGLLYKIDNQLGYGHKEKVYDNALETLLKESNIPFERELYLPTKINDKIIGRQYFDFLIDKKIILEIKTANYMYRESCS